MFKEVESNPHAKPIEILCNQKKITHGASISPLLYPFTSADTFFTLYSWHRWGSYDLDY